MDNGAVRKLKFLPLGKFVRPEEFKLKNFFNLGNSCLNVACSPNKMEKGNEKGIVMAHSLDGLNSSLEILGTFESRLICVHNKLSLNSKWVKNSP